MVELCWERSFGSFLQEFLEQRGRAPLAPGIFVLVFLIRQDAVESCLSLICCHPEYGPVQRVQGSEEHFLLCCWCSPLLLVLEGTGTMFDRPPGKVSEWLARRRRGISAADAIWSATQQGMKHARSTAYGQNEIVQAGWYFTCHVHACSIPFLMCHAPLQNAVSLWRLQGFYVSPSQRETCSQRILLYPLSLRNLEMDPQDKLKQQEQPFATGF